MGYWKNGNASGHGRLIHASGDVYEGQWENNVANGFGKFVHIHGSKQKG